MTKVPTVWMIVEGAVSIARKTHKFSVRVPKSVVDKIQSTEPHIREAGFKALFPRIKGSLRKKGEYDGEVLLTHENILISDIRHCR